MFQNTNNPQGQIGKKKKKETVQRNSASGWHLNKAARVQTNFRTTLVTYF